MDRIQELMEKFPVIPRFIITKTDVLVEGIRYSPIMQEISNWSLPDGTLAYDLSRDGSHSDVVTKANEAWIQKPLFMLLRAFKEGNPAWDTVMCWIALQERSPYEIRYAGGGHYILYRDGEPLEEVFFPLRPEWYSKKSSFDGKPLSTTLSAIGDAWLCAVSPNYCVYYDTDDECYFCPIGRTMDRFDEEGLGLKKSIRIDQLVEAFVAAYQEIKGKQGLYLNRVPCWQEGCRCIWLVFTGGALYNRKREAERYIRFIQEVKKALGGASDVKFAIEVQALERDDAERLHEVGLHAISYNMEIWDERLFEILVPGKAKYVGRDHWLECLVEAAKAYDRGHVRCNFVAGLEMTPPHGFKTEEEALESTLGGMRWLVERGIAPSFDVLMLSGATKLKKLGQYYMPSTEYFLKLGWELHKMLVEHNLYGLTPGFNCRQAGCLSTRTDFGRLYWRSRRQRQRLEKIKYPEIQEIAAMAGT